MTTWTVIKSRVSMSVAMPTVYGIKNSYSVVSHSNGHIVGWAGKVLWSSSEGSRQEGVTRDSVGIEWTEWWRVHDGTLFDIAVVDGWYQGVHVEYVQGFTSGKLNHGTFHRRSMENYGELWRIVLTDDGPRCKREGSVACVGRLIQNILTVRGNYFSANDVGGKACANVQFISAEKIKCTVPEAVGDMVGSVVDIVVTVGGGGGQTVTMDRAYRYMNVWIELIR